MKFSEITEKDRCRVVWMVATDRELRGIEDELTAQWYWFGDIGTVKSDRKLRLEPVSFEGELFRLNNP